MEETKDNELIRYIKMNASYQIAVPTSIRRKYNLKAGDILEVHFIGKKAMPEMVEKFIL